MPTVYERVRKIIVEQLGVEEEFGSDDHPVEISDEDAEKIVTVQDAVDYIKDRGIDDD